MGSIKFCPRCEEERIKTELKMLPNKFLICEKCHAAFRMIATQLYQVAI